MLLSAPPVFPRRHECDLRCLGESTVWATSAEMSRLRGKGYGRDAYYCRARRDVSGHDCIGSDRRFVSDHHPAQDGDSTSEPDLAANRDWFCAIPGITNRLVRFPGMICVTDAGVFTDQAAVTDFDSGHGYDMCAARNHYFAAQLDASISLCFQVHVRVEQHVFADAHVSASVNRDPPLHDHGCGQALAQVGGKKGMSVDTCKAPQQRSSTTQKSGQQPA
jgi:hypothetical protein